MRKILLSLLIIFSFPFPAIATMQIPDMIVTKEQKYTLHSEPLNALFLRDKGLRERLSQFVHRASCTASWDGIKATWTIENNQLYLVELIGNPCSETPTPIPLSTVSEVEGQRVAATWFTGTLRVPIGETVESVHWTLYGDDSTRYLVLEVEQGRIIRRQKLDRDAI